MAASRLLRWGPSRAAAWLLPLPARCPRRELHKRGDGTQFQSVYSLDRLYPESRGLDTAWRVPVSRGTEGRFLAPAGRRGQPGPVGRARG